MNLETSDRADREFDYIVVGTGAGGGPLAARLARRGFRVLVLEAGPGDEVASPPAEAIEVSLVPALNAAASEDPRLSWHYFVDHYDHPPRGKDPKWHDAPTDPAREGIFYPRASGLGGCTIHNAMITVAGPDTDWDDLATFLGDESWRSDRMRGSFERLERNQYLDRPTPPPLDGWGMFRDDLAWLFGREVDHTQGRHGFDGWLRTSTIDPKLALGDTQILELVKAAVVHAAEAGVGRASTFVEDVLAGRLKQRIDPNHATAQAENPEGVVLMPGSVCGAETPGRPDPSSPDVRRGRRSSPREFLLEVRSEVPDRLVIRADCLVTRVLFGLDEANVPRAVGVEFLEGRDLYRAHPTPSIEQGARGRAFVKAGGEVVLCGGTFNTPQLLMLSGIGDVDHLAEIASTQGDPDGCTLRGRDSAVLRDDDGRPRRVARPGVGRNLQDRYEISLISEMAEDFAMLQGATFEIPGPGEDPDGPLQRWRADGSGIYAANGPVLGIIKRSRPDLDQPDLFIFGMPIPFAGYKLGYSRVGRRHRSFTWAILKARTRNNGGTVRLRGTDPRETPVINFHYFNELDQERRPEDDPDLLAVVEGVKFVRGIGERASGVIERESHPGLDAVPTQDDAKIKDWILREAWGHHACGTCRMGPDEDKEAVLDGRFRVRGVAGLRVVDASIFPNIPGYFLATNIYMASEKAAAVLAEDAQGGGVDPPEYPHALRRLEAQALAIRRESARDPSEEKATDASPLSGPATWDGGVAGLGISGGGLRSATFGLGVLQALAAGGGLSRIDFLSTVGGGGFIGSFLGRFYDRLRTAPLLGGGGQASRPPSGRIERVLGDPNSPEVDWLRKQSGYLDPSGPDDLRVKVALSVRNLLIVHFVVGTLLFAALGIANALRYACSTRRRPASACSWSTRRTCRSARWLGPYSGRSSVLGSSSSNGPSSSWCCPRRSATGSSRGTGTGGSKGPSSPPCSWSRRRAWPPGWSSCRLPAWWSWAWPSLPPSSTWSWPGTGRSLPRTPRGRAARRRPGPGSAAT